MRRIALGVAFALMMSVSAKAQTVTVTDWQTGGILTQGFFVTGSSISNRTVDGYLSGAGPSTSWFSVGAAESVSFTFMWMDFIGEVKVNGVSLPFFDRVHTYSFSGVSSFTFQPAGNIWFAIDNVTYTPIAVPGPSAGAGLLPLVALLLFRRRRR